MTRLAMRRRITAATAAYLALTAPVAWAAVEATRAMPDLLGLPWLQSLVGVAVASLGGIAATLGRYMSATYEGKPFRVWGEILKDGSVSIVIGVGGYMAGFWAGQSAEVIAIGLLLSGYAGVRALTVMADIMLERLRGRP